MNPLHKAAREYADLVQWGLRTNERVTTEGSVLQPSFEWRLHSLAVWAGKKDPTVEVLTVQIRHPAGNIWETIGRLALYRTSDGDYSNISLRERLRNRKHPLTSRTKATFSLDRFALGPRPFLTFLDM